MSEVAIAADARFSESPESSVVEVVILEGPRRGEITRMTGVGDEVLGRDEIDALAAVLEKLNGELAAAVDESKALKTAVQAWREAL